MPPKKAKDENNKPETDKNSNKSTFKRESTPTVQVQNTKFDGILLLSPAAQQLEKDL